MQTHTTPAYHKRVSTRAKRLSITIHPDKRVIVTIPKRYNPNGSVVDSFISSHAQWIEKNLAKLQSVSLVSYPFTSGKKSYDTYKAFAREKITKRVGKLNSELGMHFSYGRIFIKNQKTRWGSCSASKNLNFNYKLAFLPERLMDYVIIHELCHLVHMHHRKSFWELVGKYCPDYKAHENELRKSFRL